MAAILQAYGPRKTTPTQPLPSKSEVEIKLPGFEDLPRVKLTSTSEFIEPDAWVHDGISLQVPGGGEGKVLRVRLGIDFGTAYTKVALRVADKVYFLDWSGVSKCSEKFLLPWIHRIHPFEL